MPVDGRPARPERIFFALWPGDSEWQEFAAAAAELRRRLPRAGRAVAETRYHLTLHFLGDYQETPEPLLTRAKAAAGTVRTMPFELLVDRAASFQNRQACPFWLGPSETPGALRELWRRLRDALRAHSVPFDASSRLTPHITLAYDSHPMLAPLSVRPMVWKVGSFVLIRSRPGWGDYECLGTWPLKDGADEPILQRDLWET